MIRIAARLVGRAESERRLTSAAAAERMARHAVASQQRHAAPTAIGREGAAARPQAATERRPMSRHVIFVR